MNGKNDQRISFDEFELDATLRKLTRDGKPVTLYAKTFDLLTFLVENNGRILTKDEILDNVWEGQFVEEANLSVQISALRKALGETSNSPRFLVTVPGKGYKFVADETNSDAEIVIENRQLSRVVVEEEIEDENSAVEPFAESVQSKQNNVSDSPNNSQSLIRSDKNQKIALISALIFGVLMSAGFGGYMLYRQGMDTDASESRSGLMTMVRITDSEVGSCPSISPDGRFVAFVENSSGGSGSLFLHQIDTSTTVQLLEPGERTFGCINFSPDGSFIYYIVFEEKHPEAALFSIPVLGGNPKKIVSNLENCFTVSPDGERVAFFRNDEKNNLANLVTAQIDGSDEKVLFTRSFDELKFAMGLAWSPDGKRIAFSANSDPKKTPSSLTLFEIGVNDGEIKRLTSEEFVGIGKVSWTSDGLSLGFVAKKFRDQNRLFLMDYASASLRRITNDLESYGNYGMGFSVDSSRLVANIFDRKAELWRFGVDGNDLMGERLKIGRNIGIYGIRGVSKERIAYVVSTAKGLEIKTIKEDGSGEKPLTTDSFNQQHVIGSRDGSFLIYTSDQAGERHIFKMSSEDGSEVTQLTFGNSIDSQPDISPDDRSIIYSSLRGNQKSIWKVPFVGGEAEQITDYDCDSPVFAPDGKTFACVLPSDKVGKLASIAIVQADGGEPLKIFPVVPFRWNYNIRWTPDGKSVVYEKSVNRVYNLWKQPVSGEKPQALTKFKRAGTLNFSFSSDGKSLLVSRGERSVHIVLIENFR